jgi:uroporphyrinogen-III synthase
MRSNRIAQAITPEAPLATRADTTLRGIGVVVTRPRAAAQRLGAEIERRGGNAMLFSALEIVGLPLQAQLAGALTVAGSYDYWVFVSQHAVEHGVRLLRECEVEFADVTAIAIGPTTQRALLDAGFKRVLVSEAGFDSEAALALPELQQLHSTAPDAPARTALIFRGRGGRETLRQGLEARGARVSYIECYERLKPVRPPSGAADLLQAWRAGKVHAVSAMSVQTLRNFVALMGAEGLTHLRATALFVPHERIAAPARDSGLNDIVVTGVGDAALLAALEARFASHHDRQH